MQFSQKLALLICGCVLVLGGLCLIQYRLVRNTYRLEQTAYLQQVKQRLADKTQSLSDSLNHQVMSALLNHVQGDLEKNQKPRLDTFQQHINFIADNYRRDIANSLAHDNLLSEMTYGLQYNQIVLYNGQKSDTLLSATAKPLNLTETPDITFFIGDGLQQSGFPLQINNQIKNYRLAVWTKQVIFAPHWQEVMFNRMALTLVGSVVLILAVTVIFFLVFMALLQQKKIADITTDFANNMTHELKTPLSAASVAVKSLRTPEAKLNEDWYNELLNQLNGQHEKIRRIMDSVLTSAIDQPLGMVQLREIRLSSFLKEIEILVDDSGRELRCEVNDDILINTDPDILMVILANLIDNALKYTATGTPLHIYAQTTGRILKLSVEDYGEGIPPAYQHYLFRKFFRVPRPNGEHIRGLGLGLYLCRMQAKQLGGDITYQRNTFGGSTFTITLPYDKNELTTGRG